MCRLLVVCRKNDFIDLHAYVVYVHVNVNVAATLDERTHQTHHNKEQMAKVKGGESKLFRVLFEKMCDVIFVPIMTALCNNKYINKNGKEKNKTEIVHHMGSVVNLKQCYFKQLREMSVHQFFKIWQLRNFNLSLSNIQRGQVLFMHNFQQNLLLLTQDEMLAAHWDHPQLTIHPTALFYLCLKCEKIVKEDLIHITMDKVHDKHAVNQFTQTSIEHVRKKGIPIEEIIEFTDHSASQYKSRYTFYYMTKLGIQCTRQYFSVKHGKGPSDSNQWH